jgi:DNA-binding SARP family transcriptional activator
MRGRLFLFGPLRLIDGNEPFPSDLAAAPPKFFETGSPKTQALLAYFALHHHQPLERRRLAFLLWPNTSEGAARRNLRQYLHRLRQVLEPLALTDTLQDIEGGRLMFNPGQALWVDVLAFEQALADTPRLLEQTPHIPSHLWQILELYQGDLVPDIYDDWIIPLRTHWQQQYIDLVQTLIQHTQKHQADPQTIPLAERLLQLDPLRESSHRLLMECYYRNGDRARALQQYERCQQLLQQELAAAPMPKTIALYRRIREGVDDEPFLAPPPCFFNAPQARLNHDHFTAYGGTNRSSFYLPPSRNCSP